MNFHFFDVRRANRGKPLAQRLTCAPLKGVAVLGHLSKHGGWAPYGNFNRKMMTNHEIFSETCRRGLYKELCSCKKRDINLQEIKTFSQYQPTSSVCKCRYTFHTCHQHPSANMYVNRSGAMFGRTRAVFWP